LAGFCIYLQEIGEEEWGGWREQLLSHWASRPKKHSSIENLYTPPPPDGKLGNQGSLLPKFEMDSLYCILQKE
jgi:hypothetical protein